MIEIRALKPEDAAAYVAVREVMIREEPYAFMGVPGDDRFADVDEMRRYLTETDKATFGAFIEGRLVGVAGVFRQPRFKQRHRAYIWSVYASPGVRGQGVGRGLVQACIDQARAWPGVEVVGLSASTRSVTAIRLYESMGFVRWGVEPDCTRVGGVVDDEAHYQLAIHPS